MIASSLILSVVAFFGQGAQPVSLSHTFVKGEKNVYHVSSHLQMESREAGLTTWLPQDLDISYKFTTINNELLPDGGVKLHYVRPGATEVEGETFDTPAKTTTLKEVNEVDLVLSRANEVISHSEPVHKGAKWFIPTPSGQKDLGAFLGQFVNELFRLSIFAGSLDNSLDFSPRLPLEKVKVGDTWKRTIGYQPQKLKGADTMAIQRLDYVYTYVGPMDSDGRKVTRISAKLSFDTDLAKFATQLAGTDTGLKSLPIHLTASIDFDLDPKTLKTLEADATSEGGFAVFFTDSPDEAAEEVKLKGRTSLELVGSALLPK